MSVARAQDEISATEFGRWLVFDRLEPGEPGRSDARAASIAYWIFKSAAGGKGDVKMPQFLHKFKQEFGLLEVDALRQTDTEMRNTLVSFARLSQGAKRTPSKKK
jgi:hypothetical protein